MWWLPVGIRQQTDGGEAPRPEETQAPRVSEVSTRAADFRLNLKSNLRLESDSTVESRFTVELTSSNLDQVL